MSNFKGNKLLLISMVMLLALAAVACSNSPQGENTGDQVTNPAEGYPERMIEVYVGHGPGGGTDNFVRTITGLMAEDLGATFNIINQEGGSGVIAMKNAMQKDADGYTLVGDSAYAVTVALETNEYGLDQVIPIARIQSDIYALQVKKGTFETIDELIEYAGENPGAVKLGAVGSMGMDEITARRFIKAAGVDITYVPMQGAGSMHSNILGGHIEVMLEEVGPAIGYIEQGEVVPLIFFSEERLEDFPDVPTTVEKGWQLIDGIERYLMVHADTPQEIVDLLEAAAQKAMDTEQYQEYAENSYLNLRDGWMGSEDFTNKLKEDIEIYKEIVAELGQ